MFYIYYICIFKGKSSFKRFLCGAKVRNGFRLSTVVIDHRVLRAQEQEAIPAAEAMMLSYSIGTRSQETTVFGAARILVTCYTGKWSH